MDIFQMIQEILRVVQCAATTAGIVFGLWKDFKRWRMELRKKE